MKRHAVSVAMSLAAAVISGRVFLLALFDQYALVEMAASIITALQVFFLSSAIGDLLEKKKETNRTRNSAAVLVTIFAAIASFLAAIGIYGVVAHAVSLRTREFGIRMALGAEQRDVWSLVFRFGFAISSIGVALGVAGTLALTPLIRGLLFGVGTHDPGTIAGVAALLMAMALAACWIPARRATHVDPIVALHYE